MDRLKPNAQVIKPAIVARFIRVRPKTWQGRPALRVEFFGCRSGKSSIEKAKRRNESMVACGCSWSDSLGFIYDNHDWLKSRTTEN